MAADPTDPLRLDQLDASTTLLTVNNRLAVELRARYDRRQLAAGRTAWPSADILPWSAWLHRQYEVLLDSGGTGLDLLSPVQERLLWQDIVQRSGTGSALLRPAAAAKSAQQAFALCEAWGLDGQALAVRGGEETRAFLGWRDAFIAHLSAHGLVSAAQLLPLLTEAFSGGLLPTPARLLLSGFDALAPAQAGLLECLRGHGCTVTWHGEPGRPATCRRVEAADRETEIRLAAQWAARQLHADPGLRIAVVCPQLGALRRDLERIFGEVLAPAAYLTPQGHQAMFNISLGEALTERALVAHALLALDLVHGEQPLQAIGQLLRSPFLGGHAREWEGRALLDAALREDGQPRLGLAQLRQRLAHRDPMDLRACPELAARLDRVLGLVRELPAGASPNAWAGHFQALLGAFGWPGDQPLDSQEYQQHERLRRVFSELAGLGKLRPRLSRDEALGWLRTLAAEALFQAESPPAPLQILGPLEAAGMDFDRIWLLGMDDQAWPAPPRPNPLLPFALQRALGMPHASAARELAFASALTNRLAASAPLLIASHARSVDGREQRPSPLLRDWPQPAHEALPQGPATARRAACAVSGELSPQPPPARHGAPPEARGGAGLLAAQASCPFQAVARYRLAARPLAEPSFVPDAALSGSLVHELLQRVWQHLGDAATLARHDGAALQGLIGPLAAATLADIGRRRPDLYTPRLCALEAQRLTRLAVEWLEIERRRAQPFSVIGLEQDRPIALGGLALDTRADRVDRLADGSLAIIDYKTGRTVSNEGWFDERLSEPQLPLYCLGGGEVSAALLARVRADDRGCGFVGLSRDPDFAPGVGTPQARDAAQDWAAVLRHWRQALGRLAAEILEGRADPTPSVQACQYCPFGALCRVEERTEGDADD